MARMSGLQKDVLSLYRDCIRAARRKPIDVRFNFIGFAREEFRSNATIDKKDFAAIEYLMRKGRRQLDIYAAPGIRNVAH